MAVQVEKTRYRLLKVPEPAYLMMRAKQNARPGLLSRQSRAAFVKPDLLFLLVKEGEPTKMWGVVRLQPGTAFRDGPAAIDALGPRLDEQTRREFADESGQVWFHPIAVVEAYKQPLPVTRQTPGRRYTGRGTVEKKLSEAEKRDIAREDALIAENKKKPAARSRHHFKPAKWTHPNGHPRCIVCGQSKRTGGWCNVPGQTAAATKEDVDPTRLGDEKTADLLAVLERESDTVAMSDATEAEALLLVSGAIEREVAKRSEADPGDDLLGQARLVIKGLREHVSAAVWPTAYKNKLPDSAFLYVAPGGKKDDEGKTVPRTLRYFPVRDDKGKLDIPHVRNAIQQIPKSTAPGLTADKMRALQDKARRLLEEARKKTEKSRQSRRGKISRPQRCKYDGCEKEAEFAVIWADGRAYVAACPSHKGHYQRHQSDVVATWPIPTKSQVCMGSGCEKPAVFAIVDKYGGHSPAQRFACQGCLAGMRSEKTVVRRIHTSASVDKEASSQLTDLNETLSWAADALKDGVAVEPKYSGPTVMVRRDSDGVVALFLDGAKVEQADYLPSLSKATEALDRPALMVGGLVGHDGDARMLVRDVLHWGDTDVTDRPWDERRPFRKRALRGIQGDAFVDAPSRVVHTEQELRDAIRWAGREPGSLGAVLKSVNGTCDSTGHAMDAVDFLATRGVDAVVLDHQITKDAQARVYTCGVGPVDNPEDWQHTTEARGKHYVTIGKTLASNITAEPGDVLRIEATELLLDTREPRKLTWFTPMVVGKHDGQPMKTADVERLVRPDETKKHFVIKAKHGEYERYVFGLVLEPNDGDGGNPFAPDLQKDTYSAEEIWTAWWNYSVDSRKQGLLHQKAVSTNGMVLLDNYVMPADMTVNGQHFRKGSWVMGAHVKDDELWKGVLDGTYNGWSIQGSAIRELMRRVA
jgi:hypothetical protein